MNHEWMKLGFGKFEKFLRVAEKAHAGRVLEPRPTPLGLPSSG